MKMFETFKSSGQIFSNSLCQFWNESIPAQIFVSLVIFMKDNSSIVFFRQTIYALIERSPLQWKFWRLTSAQVKICKISYLDFEMTSRFLSKFCIPLYFHERLFVCTFLAQTIYTFLKRSPLNWKFWRLTSAQVKICKISYVNLKWQIDSSVNFVSHFSFMKDYSNVLF